ncbi:DnaJ C-terminal domain-containing protein [Variovorax rhizosphaerae]|uniref:DnaJ C-terminal domain-containing protein n=1 Tax=Variovorax rhizosphaerae TaxID=1836200 RepID=A0ABU8WDQ9_9BURK
MGTDNAFAELGLAPDATDSEVKAAWRRLVSQWHPDRNSSADAVARMQRINRAFEEIRNAGPRTAPAARAASTAESAKPRKPAQESARASAADASQASQRAHGNASAGHASSGHASSGRASSHASGNPSDNPSGHAAGNAAHHAADNAADPGPNRRPIYRKVKLTLEEAAIGCIKVMQGKITETCTVCAGAGHQVLGGNCAQCGGSGATAKRSFFGWPTGYYECTACLGGGIARRPCKACAGVGKATPQPYKVGVRIPAGVRPGDLLHVDARRASKASPPADLEIRVEFAEHDFFKLEDDGTIHCEIPVDGFAWIANRVIQVPTVAGLQSLKLKRDQVAYRLKGHGFPVSRGGPRGDQQVTVQPIFPDHLTADQEILLDQLLATTSGDGGTSDKRLRAWNSGLRAWEREMSKRAS